MNSKRRFIPVLAGVVVFTTAVLLILLVTRQNTPPAQNTVVGVSTNAASPNGQAQPVGTPTVVTNTAGAVQPLFAIAHETAFAMWTDADGKDTNVIRQLAHNPLEYARMVEENPRIFRRQLVYLKETAASVFEKAKLTGDPVRQLTLPGLDGQELPFEITKRQGEVSSRQGMFSGHLAGNTDSLVTLAYEDGREAFTILSPKQSLFIVAEPREDGQVIVKAIDPNTYGVGPAQADDSPGPQPTNK